MISPAPWQRGHVCDTWKNPRELITCPRPAHVGQVVLRERGSAPLPWHLSQVSSFSISIIFSAPKAASSNLISMSYRRSDPRRRSSERAPGPPPKNVSKNSAAKPPPEHFAEDFERIMETAAAETGTASRERGMTKAIVRRTFVRIHQDVVR